MGLGPSLTYRDSTDLARLLSVVNSRGIRVKWIKGLDAADDEELPRCRFRRGLAAVDGQVM